MPSSILSVIQHYQRSIENSEGDEKRLFHCINKLYKLPVKVEHLQETGIGKTVNSLRKYHGEIGAAAKTLVTKWKAMVAAEEESTETKSQVNGKIPEDDTYPPSGAATSEDEDRDKKSYTHTPNHPIPQTIENPKKEHSSLTRENGKHHKHERHEKSSKTTDNKPSSKSQSVSEEKSHKNSHENSTKDKKPSRNHEEKDAPGEKKHKKHEHEKSDHKNDGHRHKKEDKSKDRSEKHSSREKKHSKSGEVLEKSSKHSDNAKHSSGGKDKLSKEKSKESKSERSQANSREKSEEHYSCTARPSESSSSKKPTTTTSSSSNSKADKRRHHNVDDDDEVSPKAKAAKIEKKSKHNVIEKNEDDDCIDSSPKAKAAKIEKKSKHKLIEKNEVDDGIDSSMGANFADVLGMLNMPTKKSIKSLNTLKSPNTSNAAAKYPKEDSSSKNRAHSQTEKISTSASTSSFTIKQKPRDVKPDLLASDVKLAPLDPSLVLELPAISTNYKPLPVNQTVMDCVYSNLRGVSTPSAPVRTLSDADAIAHGISSKTMRTKIYSGYRTGQINQVPSLFDLCTRVLQKNIDALEYTGGVPFEVLRPVLERATPQQLLLFEEFNSYILEDSDVLWRIHCQRSFRGKKREENECWKEMFLRCQYDEERRLNNLTESIKMSQKIVAAPVRKTQLAFVDSMVKPPRNVLRKQEQYGTKAKLVATPAARVAALSSITPNAAKLGDARLRAVGGARDAASASVSSATIRPKKAPLMAKTLQSMRGLYKR